MKSTGYTGRKLDEYTWIPKSKTYLREYREFLKICYDVQKKERFFNDKSVGEEMVNRRAIVDRDNTAGSYIEKYKDKSIGNQSYVSNARMMIRICRWLGWISKTAEDAKFQLTPYGINLTKFSGPFPSKISDLNEYNLVTKAFAKLKYYSVNDSPQYRNRIFKQRIFLNMLKVLSNFEHCSHYELVVSSFVLKDERNEKEFEFLLNRINRLKNHQITIGQALKECNLDVNNKSRVTGVYDGPKVMLSFARQLGLVENIAVNKIDTPSIYEEYSKMYQKSGHIKPNGIKFVSRITDKGRAFVEEHSDKKIIWFDELNNKIRESVILIYLNKKKTHLILNNINSAYGKAITNLLAVNFIQVDNKKIKLLLKTDFDLYQDIPYEERDKVIKLLQELDSNFLDLYDEVVDRMGLQELFINRKKFNFGECVYCANPKCKSYPQYTSQYGASDRFADRVCPVNIIKIDKDGKIDIEKEECINCMLCVSRCPFQALSIHGGKLLHNKAKDYISIRYDHKIKETELLISKEANNYDIELGDITPIIINFEKKIKIPGKELKKDEFYLLVRNYFRAFGFLAAYSGSGGMKTRSDVTLLEPYLITSEIKSPAEGPINLKAVRQAFDAAVQLGTQITLAIGDTTHRGAIEQEEKYRKVSPQVKICLMEIRYLFFLFLVRRKLQIKAEDIKNLLENNPGYFDKEKLKTFAETQAKKYNISNETLNSIKEQIKNIP